jgi:hypothetical protein
MFHIYELFKKRKKKQKFEQNTTIWIDQIFLKLQVSNVQ